MFCIHYLFEDEVKLRTLLQNLNDNLKIGGFVIGTTFDGERVYSNLEGKQSISGKTKEGEIMWKIEKNYGTPKIQFTDKKALYGKEIDVFVKTIGRNHKEFLVNFKYFDKIMEEYGFSLVSRKPFEEYYNELIEEKNIASYDPKELKKNIEMAKNMSEDEKRFSFLSSGFIYKKERNSSDSLFKKLVELMEKKDVKESKGKKVKGAISKNTENLIEFLEE
jgi:mRNA (guanine-N7-)-methyltransferase